MVDVRRGHYRRCIVLTTSAARRSCNHAGDAAIARLLACVESGACESGAERDMQDAVISDVPGVPAEQLRRLHQVRPGARRPRRHRRLVRQQA